MANTLYLRKLMRCGALLALAAIAACSPLDRLQRMQEEDSGSFHSNLAAEYLAFAESEQELQRDKSSTFFAKKGLRAAQGKDVQPEKPANWEIDTNTRMELRNARERLMRVRSEFFTRVASQSVARAQMLYDCWVMQSVEHTDNDLTLPCRGEFLGELASLEQIIATLGPKPQVNLPARYTILFPLGSAELDKNAKFTIQEVLAVTRLFPLYTIDITGHADRSGSQQRNLVLSTQRAAHVAQALVDAGINSEQIGFSADGEANPAIPTLDGIRRERNRRVEIAVLPLLAPPASPVSAEVKDGM